MVLAIRWYLVWCARCNGFRHRRFRPHSLTHSLTHSPTHSLTHSLTHSGIADFGMRTIPAGAVLGIGFSAVATQMIKAVDLDVGQWSSGMDLRDPDVINEEVPTCTFAILWGPSPPYGSALDDPPRAVCDVLLAPVMPLPILMHINCLKSDAMSLFCSNLGLSGPAARPARTRPRGPGRRCTQQ